jgi:hypothetical protein
MKLYGIAEIARALDTDPGLVGKWRERHELPPPDAELATGPVWLADTIEPVLAAGGPGSARTALREYRVVPEAGSRPATVYYLCPDTNKPHGGIRSIYQHVDVLNSLGVAAFVAHHSQGFVCDWFEHQTRVVAEDEVTLTPADIIVVPEIYVQHIRKIPAGPRLVVFSQGAYLSFGAGQSVSSWKYCLDDRKLEALMVVSRDSEEYMRYAFPGVNVVRVRNFVDGQIFHPAERLPGRKIAVMPGRGRNLCTHVLSLLTMRGSLDGWEVADIDGLPQREVAEILRSAAIFLSFSEREGFGMPPAEAMACGCYVVGFTGLGGREFFYPGLCVPVEEGNVLALANMTEQAMSNFNMDASNIRKVALRASTIIRNEYSLEKQTRDIVSFLELLALRGTPGLE